MFRHARRPRQDPRLRPREAEVRETRVRQTDLQTISGGTQPGVVLGTMGYMAPEQVRGKPADKRSRPLLVRRRSCTRCCRASARSAATRRPTRSRRSCRRRPPDLSQTNKDVRPASSGSCRHCLEKNPERALRVGARRRFRPGGALDRLDADGGRRAQAPGRTDAPAVGPARPGGRPRRRDRESVRLLGRKEGRLRPAAVLPPDHVLPRRGRMRAASRRTARRSSTPQAGRGNPSRSSSTAPRARSRGRSASAPRRSCRSRRPARWRCR